MRLIPKSTRSGLALLIGLAALLAGCGGGAGGGGKLVGAGSTLVAPLVARWSSDYGQRRGVTVTYGALGSAAGIAQTTGRSVDFGATDAPLTQEQRAACHCVQVPIAFAATLLAYHGKGLPGTLKLSGPVLADIFLGRITSWNDPAIARLNPNAKLPATAITPVYRSDGSGDTYVFSAYLSKVSAEWKRKLGVSTELNFSAGTGGRGNQGVAAAIDRTNGAIGYLGIPYVFSNHLRYALVENEAGAFPAPGIASITAAAGSASAPGAYPISTITYALVPRSSGKADQLRAFLTYAIGDGQALAPSLHFAPLPFRIRDAGRKAIAEIG